MFGGKKPGRRFSLLLLEEGEFYVKDYVAHAEWPAGMAGNWQRLPRLAGQLRLCTKSLFFEPDDVRIPIVRLPFQHMDALGGAGGRSLEVCAQRLVKMRANAADVPYTFERGAPTTWRFELSYAELDDFMPLAQQMLVASRLPGAEQEEMLAAFMQQLEAGLRFDAGHLRNPASEAVALELGTLLLTPLVRDPGRLVVTDARLYFQPMHNVSGDTPVHSHPLAAVAAVARRRSSLRDVGLELFFMQPQQRAASSGGEGGSAAASGPYWGSPSAFFAFKSREDREQAIHILESQPELGSALPGGRAAAAACGSILEAEGAWLGRVTQAWRLGRISNFDYLMFCNMASGRSFNDLTQWPVFPWVLADYSSAEVDLSSPHSFRDLSKPVGALSPARLNMFRRRLEDLQEMAAEPPFLYGTHYSCPGYTMYWLVRAAPAHMLRLQSGRFDSPDRLFCSVGDSWDSVLSNPTDVKELIPEFFMQRADFLRNRHSLALGTRQSGKPVGNVELPPWAAGSPEHFLAIQRAALEAPFVSANLHHWIDLIFGYKQQGAAAEEADNVFRHTAYEGGVDLAAVADPTDRAALEMQVNEFGQCPRVLFTQPHPPRLVCPPPPSPEAAFPAVQQAGVSREDSSGQALSLALVSAILAAAAADEAPPPVEVPALLRELDVLAGRETELGTSSGAAVLALTGDGTTSQPASLSAAAGAGAAPADERLLGNKSGKGLRNWASERGAAVGAAVGERLAGSVGIAADRASSGLRGFFAKKPGPPEPQSPVAGAAAAADSTPQPLSPAARMSSSLSSRWQSFTSARSQSGSAQVAAAAASGVEWAAGGALDEAAEGVVGQEEPSSRSGSATTGPSNVVWKVARGQPPQRGHAPSSAAGGGCSSSEDEAEGQPEPPTLDMEPATSRGSVDAGGGRADSSTARTQTDFMLAQKLRLLGAQRERAAAAGSGWGQGLRERVQQQRVFVAGSEAVNAVALASGSGGTAHLYAAGHSGFKVFNLATGEQLRSAKLGSQPLTSLVLLPAASSSAAGSFPLLLCAGYDACVHAYSLEYATELGSSAVHEDAVSCMALLPGTSSSSSDSAGGSGTRLVTGSWDCSAKVWALAEGREPWRGGGGAQPAAVLAEESGMWAVAVCQESPHILFTGTEEGVVSCWDLRLSSSSNSKAWQQQLCQDYVGGLSAVPGGAHALAAGADGRLVLLDLRRGGAQLAAVPPSGSPLRCCATDGSLALAGDESGALHFWDVGQALGRAAVQGRWAPPGANGLYEPLPCAPASAINALGVASLAAAGGGKEELWLATGHEGGVARSYRA